jgi:hypothetical protein
MARSRRSRIWRQADRSPPCLRSAPFPTAQASFGPVVAAGSCGERQPRRECRLGDEAEATSRWSRRPKSFQTGSPLAIAPDSCFARIGSSDAASTPSSRPLVSTPGSRSAANSGGVLRFLVVSRKTTAIAASLQESRSSVRLRGFRCRWRQNQLLSCTRTKRTRAVSFVKVDGQKPISSTLRRAVRTYTW